MRKKIILAAALVAVAAIPASALDTLVTWCGKEVYVIDIDALPEDTTLEELKEYYQSLNVELCGSEGGYTIIHNP